MAASLICLLTSLILSQQPGVRPWEVSFFAPAGFMFMATAALMHAQRIAYRAGVTVILSLMTALLLFRVIMLFVDRTFDAPAQGMFMPVFAYFSVLPLLFVILLPHPQSARLCVAAWLSLAVVTTIGVLPHWNDHPPRQFLAATLIYVWLGHGLFVALLCGWASQQKALIDGHIRLASSEHGARAESEASEARFSAIFDQVAAGIGLFDSDGRWCEVNARLCELLGYSEAELIGHLMSEVTPPDDHAAFRERLNLMISGSAPDYSVERRALRKDGSVIWLQAQLRKLDLTPGQPVRGVLVVVDITDRKLAERAAAEHERVREFHFSNTPLAVIEWTPDMRVKRWSARAEAIFGWSENEIVGKGIADWHFVHENDVDSTLRVAFHMIGGRESLITAVHRNHHRDGRVLWCEWHNSILRDASGAVVSLISLVEHITERKMAMAALDKSEAKLRSFFEQAAVGMSLLNADGSWNTVNDRLCTLTGYSQQELLAIDYQTITLPEDLGLDLDRAHALIEGEIDGYEIEKRFIHKQGHIVWVKVYASRIAPKDDDPALYVAVVEDISERKRAEAALQQLAANLELRVADRTEQLQHTMRNWARRNQEQRALGEMMTRLPAANTLEESSRIVALYVPQIFERYGGAVWLGNGLDGCLHRLAQWGCVATAPPQIAPEDCWSIRRREPLRIDDPHHPQLCPHLSHSHVPHALRPHTCAPIIALGETVGMLHLEWGEQVNAEVLPPDPVTVNNCAKQIGMAIGNVRLREELKRLAIRDPLTGLFNRRHFDETLQRRISEFQRTGRMFSLLMIDIDHFKKINDTHGHPVGDEVLCAVAELLQRSGRADEGAFRLGGEEFVLLIEDNGQGVAAGCAERLRREVETMLVPAAGRRLPPITISVGVASYPRDDSANGSLLQKADSALYTAKRTGRNRVCHASAATGTEFAVVQPTGR